MGIRIALLCLALAIAPAAAAKTFRWSSQGDASTLDPHGQNESFTNGMNGDGLRVPRRPRQGLLDRALARHLVEEHEPDHAGSSRCGRTCASTTAARSPPRT